MFYSDPKWSKEKAANGTFTVIFSVSVLEAQIKAIASSIKYIIGVKTLKDVLIEPQNI